MADIVITPIQSAITLAKSTYPTGASASVVRAALIANTNVISGAGISDVDLSTTPFTSIGPFSEAKIYTVFVRAYEENDEVIVLSSSQISYTIYVNFFDDDAAEVDTTPPTITPKSGTDIIIQTGQFSSSTTFINTYFTISDPQSGVASRFLNPTIDFTSVRARGSVQVIAVNGDGYQ